MFSALHWLQEFQKTWWARRWDTSRQKVILRLVCMICKKKVLSEKISRQSLFGWNFILLSLNITEIRWFQVCASYRPIKMWAAREKLMSSWYTLYLWSNEHHKRYLINHNTFKFTTTLVFMHYAVDLRDQVVKSHPLYGQGLIKALWWDDTNSQCIILLLNDNSLSLHPEVF